MIDRDYVLNRLKSRALSPAEFNYEILSAPPLYSLLTPEDIKQLNYYATSPKYSAKLKEKYEAIDKIMKNRGFEKLVSGTNRVAYKPLFADNFIIKVAYDTVALQDSIREYRNQFLLKPFCTKVFEVSACGTVGVFERVNPITSRKEYMSMAADIFTLLSDYVIGKYIIDDIGTQYYQNIGFRYGFGPVILDFPYVYEVDPKKIWCNKPDYNDPTGYCNGPIDYDFGFNKLMCMKCGAEYKPFELAKKIEYKPQFINESEDIKMKIKMSGGTLGKCEEIVTGDFRNPVNAIASKLLNKKVEKIKKQEEAQKTVNGVTPAVEKESEEVVEEEVKEEKKVVKPAFEINEETKIEGDPGYINRAERMEDLLKEINNLYNYSDTSDEDKDEFIKAICEFLEDIFLDNMEISIKMIANIFRKKKNLKDEIVKEFIKSNSCSINNQLLRLLITSGNYHAETEIAKVSVENGNVVFTISSDIIKNDTGKMIVSVDETNCSVSEDIIAKQIGASLPENTVEPIYELNVDEFNENFFCSELAEAVDEYDGVIINKKDIFDDEEAGKVLVIRNDNGKYLTLNHKVIAINKIDERMVKDITIVPKEWYKEAMNMLDNIKQAPTGVFPENETVNTDESSEEEATGEE